MQDFRKLRVWKAAHAFTLDVYRLTSGFPATERYGLTLQVRRSAGAIGANISEACGRDTPRDKASYVQHSVSSSFETLNHLLLARDLGYLTAEQFETLERQLAAIRRMTVRFLKRIREDDTPEEKRRREARNRASAQRRVPGAVDGGRRPP